jgi:hypothetical protein
VSAGADNVLAAFNALAPEEQQQVAMEILRRSTATGELSDEAFDELAADLFRSYDAEESISAER